MPSRADREVILRAIEKCALDLSRAFRDNPYRYLCELDIQATYLSLLRNTLDASGVGQIRLPGKDGNAQRPYVLSLVNAEYHVPDASGRIDVACIEPERARAITATGPENPGTYLFNLPLLAAVEFKLLQYGYPWKNLTDGCRRDWNKLKGFRSLATPGRSVEHILVLGFVQHLEGVQSGHDRWTEKTGLPRTEIELDAAYIVSKAGIFMVPPT